MYVGKVHRTVKQNDNTERLQSCYKDVPKNPRSSKTPRTKHMRKVRATKFLIFAGQEHSLSSKELLGILMHGNK